MSRPRAAASVTQAQSARAYKVLGIDHLIHMPGEATSGGLTLVEMIIPAGLGVPRHVHTLEDETFHVTEGEVFFALGSDELVAAAGTTVFAPRHVPHSFQAAGIRPARMMLVITPAGLEPMFRELSRLGSGPRELSQVAEIVSGYGISFA